MVRLLPFIGALGLVACGDDNRFGPSDGGTAADRTIGDCTPAPEGTPEACSDGVDNNCNALVDCSDLNCSGVGACPVCGEVDTPLGSPLALPDGVGDITCTTDADCPGEQRCFTIEGLFGP